MKMKKSNFLIWLDFVAVVIIVITFFVISYFGYFTGDDFVMDYRVSSISDVFERTKNWYFTLGGRYFSVASQYLFVGMLWNNRVWFDIMNTVFFLLLLLACGRLISNSKKGNVFYVLLFALLFWFLCPFPSQTLFWAGGSITHLWANALVFAFLALFLRYKDENFSVVGKFGLFIVSVFAASEYIPCASLCGAFVVYYAFHIKSFRGNVIPFVVGFTVGSMIVLFAPGNFERIVFENVSYHPSRLLDLVRHPIREIVKYKALWLFLFVLALGWIKNKEAAKIWMKKNSFLLSSLGWSVIAFSVVFRPNIRALFFPETLSIVLLLRFLFWDDAVLNLRFLDEDKRFVRCVVLVLLYIAFMVDAVFAVSETKKQSLNNKKLLKELLDSGGVVASERVFSSHRFAYPPFYNIGWEFEPLADKYGLDSVIVYPHFCQDKFFKQAPPLENIYIDDELKYSSNSNDAFGNGIDVFGKYVRLIVRVESEYLQGKNNHIIFTIDYTRPRKWYKSWLDKLRNYQYERTSVFERDEPDVCFEGYCYYIIWFDRENVKGLKSIIYEIE
jgi:hypothetical protein